jgi:hypothetical protein
MPTPFDHTHKLDGQTYECVWHVSKKGDVDLHKCVPEASPDVEDALYLEAFDELPRWLEELNTRDY